MFCEKIGSNISFSRCFLVVCMCESNWHEGLGTYSSEAVCSQSLAALRNGPGVSVLSLATMKELGSSDAAIRAFGVS